MQPDKNCNFWHPDCHCDLIVFSGASSVARGYSGYIDKLTNNTISSALTDAMPMSVDGFSSYPDFLAFALILSLTGSDV